MAHAGGRARAQASDAAQESAQTRLDASRAPSPIEVRPIAGALGAEIGGVDLSDELSEATIAAIRRVWLDHCVVFFRAQPLAPAHFLRFARRFGEIVEYPFIKGIEGFREIIPVVKLEHEKTNFGGIWHSDTSYLSSRPWPPC
jgi:taurine dioxygenase